MEELAIELFGLSAEVASAAQLCIHSPMLERVVLVWEHLSGEGNWDAVIFALFRVEKLRGELLEQGHEDRLRKVEHQTF